MSNKAYLNKQLEVVTSLIVTGRYEDAYRVMELVKNHPESHLLGPITALGLPRRLHSMCLKLAKAENDAIRRTGYQYNLVPPSDTLGKYAGFSIDEKKLITVMNRQPVPKKIHQIWIGSKEVPVGTKAWRQHATLNNYDYQLWDETSLQTIGLEQNQAYKTMLTKGDMPGAVDVARYAILERFGGIYLDCDWYPVRNDFSFNDVLPMLGLTTLDESTPRKTGKGSVLLANSFIAAPAGHLVFQRLLKALPEVCTELPKAPAWWSTGPLMFTLMSRGGSLTLADADLVAGQLPAGTALTEVEHWCARKRLNDSGLLLAWRSWSR